MNSSPPEVPVEPQPPGGPPPPPSAGAPPPPDGRWAERRAVSRKLAAAMFKAVQTQAPGLRRAALAFGDGLGAIGWGKFFLLAVLALAIGGLLGSIFVKRAVVVEANDDTPVDVRVIVDGKGLHIAPPAGSDWVAPTLPPPAPSPATSSVRSGDPSALPSTPAVGAPTPTPVDGKGRVHVDGNGVRISGDNHGRPVEVTIDRHGIRIEERQAAGDAGKDFRRGLRDGWSDADKGSGAPKAVEGPAVEIPADVMDDPDKVEAAVEAARSKVEEIVKEQVDRRVARVRHNYQEEKGDWLMSLIVVGILALVIVKIVLGSKRKAESRARQASATAAEEGLKRQLVEAQLKMMQAQVEPHFLFNTLASVDYLIETDPGRASRMQKNLIQYLRAALPQMREGSTTLGKEIALCRAYLEILKVRMDERLQVALIVPQGLQSARFPPMMLQTLVENAIKHGLEPKADGGALTLSADVATGQLRVTVADTGLGFGAAARPGMGVGLANVRERLAALYGAQARLTLAANSPSGTIATIEVPYAFDTTAEGAAAGVAAEPRATDDGLTAQPA